MTKNNIDSAIEKLNEAIDVIERDIEREKEKMVGDPGTPPHTPTTETQKKLKSLLKEVKSDVDFDSLEHTHRLEKYYDNAINRLDPDESAKLKAKILKCDVLPVVKTELKKKNKND